MSENWREKIAELELKVKELELQLSTEKDNAAVDALDAIVQLCGQGGWEYPGQVVRDVAALVEERDTARKRSHLRRGQLGQYVMAGELYRALYTHLYVVYKECGTIVEKGSSANTGEYAVAIQEIVALVLRALEQEYDRDRSNRDQ